MTKPFALGSAARTLLCGAFSIVLLAACEGPERVPARSASPTTATVVSEEQQPGVTSAQPQPPAEPPPPGAPPTGATSVVEPEQPQPPGVNVAPPAYGGATPSPYDATPPYGATAPQADTRDHAERVVAQASQQISRLERMRTGQSENNATPRLDVDSALSDLQNKRERVLQDMRELALEPASRSSAVQAQLDADVAALQRAISSSYAVAPPPSQGLPQPSPLPPSQLP
ncbi:MAG TPA: hypothetical protein VE987_17990 [Polyangiaceae bacterium]|nr:hypothetical protein [Polyangiaceae bacterium]